MKTGFPAKLLTAKYKFIPCMFQSYIFVFLCAFLYCLYALCVFVCVSVFFLLCVIARRTLCNIPYRLQTILISCICKENGCLVFLAPVVIPESHYQKLLLACYNLTVKLLLLLLRSSGMHRKQNTQTQQSWLLLFSFSPSLYFSLFLPHFFFSCWAFSKLHFGWKRFLGKLLGS